MNKYSYFCTGCGLCKALYPNDVEIINDKFRSFAPKTREANKFCEQVCLCCDNSENYSSQEVFGSYSAAYFTYSSDRNIRSKCSTGGTLTSILLFLLKHKMVDGIIQIEKKDAYSSKMGLHTTPEDVLSCTGSKYIDSSNLENVTELIDSNNKKYCFIGKPCEVSTLRRYAKINSRINNIIYFLSFFCAGISSVEANKKLVEAVGCNKEDCTDIAYRGNGWPGKTIITDNHGKIYETTYENAWMNYLGRDTRTICRFCIDGVGEMADISCGDAWYIKDGKPNFDEKEGRNITFARTDKGLILLNDVIASKSLYADSVPDLNNYLKLANPYQFTRRATLAFSILALRLTKRPFPNYNKKILWGCSKYLNFKEKFCRILGTLKRIKLGKF